MDWSITFILIATFYSVLFFFDKFFKSCAHYPYIQFLKNTGFSIHFFRINWITTAFNRLFMRWGSYRFCSQWYTIGTYISLLLLPVSLILLLYGFIQNFLPKSTKSDFAPTFEVLLPGVTLPLADIWYYVFSLILSTAFHETGHAMAAVKEDVHIISFGVTLVLILPVAYVQLSSESINSLSPWRALKILCAGVWHNIILSLLAAVIYYSLPVLFNLFFITKSGVIINNLAKNSPLAAAKGLALNDIITNINFCETTSADEYVNCLIKVHQEKLGFCVDADTVHNLDESVPLRHTKTGMDCCPDGKTGSICFEYLEKGNDGILEIPPHACLNARTIIETSKHNCNNHLHCPIDLYCLKPLLDNNTSLMKISLLNKPADHVIYVGHPYDLVQTVDISGFIPKYQYSWLLHPDEVLKFLQYVSVISVGLAIINLIPCVFMDGQHIINKIISWYTKDQENLFLATVVTLICTTLLVIQCILMLCISIM